MTADCLARFATTSKGACAYVRIGVPRIFVNSSCPTYLAAGESLFEAMKLAAILRHEMAHLDGEDEAQARAREAITFRELLRRAPAHLLTPGILRRRTRETCRGAAIGGRGVKIHALTKAARLSNEEQLIARNS